MTTPLAAVRVRTFIVEDSPIILDNLVAMLEEMAPVQVVGSAPDEAGALLRMAQLHAAHAAPDLVIVDIFLKSGSGLGVLRATTQAGLKARRVVLTNYATPDMRDKCQALGADRVFDKSNEIDGLLAYCARLAEDLGAPPAPAPD
jgi:DNA-binding NarL/FixJ family response regulator